MFSYGEILQNQIMQSCRVEVIDIHIMLIYTNKGGWFLSVCLSVCLSAFGKVSAKTTWPSELITGVHVFSAALLLHRALFELQSLYVLEESKLMLFCDQFGPLFIFLQQFLFVY